MARPPSSTSNVLLYFLAVFVPPAVVIITDGCGCEFLINFALLFLGWIPAVLHAFWRVSKLEKREQRTGGVFIVPAAQHQQHSAPAHGGHYNSQPGYAPPPPGPAPQEAYPQKRY